MINLEKGQRISMDKGLSLVGVGLGWDPNEGSGYDFDLDASAFMLGVNGQIPKQDFFVFYGNQKAPDGSVESTGDDLTGGNSDGGDDETLNVDLTKVSPQIQEIIFTATIIRRKSAAKILDRYAILIFVSMMPRLIQRLLAMIWTRISLSRQQLSSVVCIAIMVNGSLRL